MSLMVLLFAEKVEFYHFRVKKGRQPQLSELEGNEEEEAAHTTTDPGYGQDEDALEEDVVDNSDLAQLIPPDEEEEKSAERRKRTSHALNYLVKQDPPTESMSMSWILPPQPQTEQDRGGQCCPLSQLCCPSRVILLDLVDGERNISQPFCLVIWLGVIP